MRVNRDRNISIARTGVEQFRAVCSGQFNQPGSLRFSLGSLCLSIPVNVRSFRGRSRHLTCKGLRIANQPQDALAIPAERVNSIYNVASDVQFLWRCDNADAAGLFGLTEYRRCSCALPVARGVLVGEKDGVPCRQQFAMCWREIFVGKCREFKFARKVGLCLSLEAEHGSNLAPLME